MMFEGLVIEPRLIYLMAVFVVVVLFLLAGLRSLKLAEFSRKKKAQNQDTFEAVETDAPEEEDLETITSKAAVKSIENRFVIIRRVYVPLILAVGLLFVVIPFLPAVPGAYISLLAGAIAVVIGIAAKPLIENIVSGLVITFSQPIRVNDTVIVDGKYGTVERINFLYTTIKIWNWNRWVVPNAQLLTKEFENLSKGDEQEWAYVEFFVAPDSDIELVKKLAKDSMQCKYLMDIEAPSFWIMNVEKDSVRCWVAGWAKNAAEAWALKSKTRFNLMKSFMQNGIHLQKTRAEVSGNFEGFSAPQ